MARVCSPNFSRGILLSTSSWVLGHTTFHENSEPQHPHLAGSSATWSSYATSSRRPARNLPCHGSLQNCQIFFILHLDFRSEGEDDGEMERLIISLELQGVIHSSNFLPVTIVNQKNRPLTQSPTPHLSVHVPISLSGIDLKRSVQKG